MELEAKAIEAQRDREFQLELARIKAEENARMKSIEAEHQRASSMEERQFNASRDDYMADKEGQKKAQEDGEKQQRLDTVMKQIEDLKASLSRPLKIVRGADGRAQALH